MRELMRDEELAGGLKNALERGQSLEEAKRSFLNAGYTRLEVESAVRKLSQLYPSLVSKLNNVSGQRVRKANEIKEEMRASFKESVPVPPNPSKSAMPVEKNVKKVEIKKQIPEDEEVYRSQRDFPKFLLWALIALGVLIVLGVVFLWMFWDKLF